MFFQAQCDFFIYLPGCVVLGIYRFQMGIGVEQREGGVL